MPLLKCSNVLFVVKVALSALTSRKFSLHTFALSLCSLQLSCSLCIFPHFTCTPLHPDAHASPSFLSPLPFPSPPLPFPSPPLPLPSPPLPPPFSFSHSLLVPRPLSLHSCFLFLIPSPSFYFHPHPYMVIPFLEGYMYIGLVDCSHFLVVF